MRTGAVMNPACVVTNLLLLGLIYMTLYIVVLVLSLTVLKY